MELYLIRHGETDYNKERKIQGSCDIPLNEYGRELARETAEGLKDIPFDVIFTSPLCRARETAEWIARGRQIPVYEDKRLQEICFGEYEGLCCGRRGYNVPDGGVFFDTFFFDTENYQAPPGGESFEDVISRTGAFLTELLQKREYQDKTVLLSTHGCALKAILANIYHTPVAEFWGEGVHKNCAVTHLSVKGTEFQMIEEGKIYYTPRK